MRKIPEFLENQYIYKIRGYGNHVILREKSGKFDEYFCSREFVMDASVKRNGSICLLADVEAYDFETLKFKDPDEFINPEDFDIIAYKKCGSSISALQELISGIEPEWDWQEVDDETTQELL